MASDRSRGGTRSAWRTGLVGFVTLVSAPHVFAQRVAVADTPSMSTVQSRSNADPRIAALAMRPVRLVVTNVSVEEALQRIAAQAKLILAFSATDLAGLPNVTLRLTDVVVSDAFRHVLQNSGLHVVITASGRATVVVGPEEIEQRDGVIMGHVVDGSTNRPVRDVSILIQGTKYGTLSDATGTFRIVDVPAGKYHVIARRVGYGRADHDVTLHGGDTATVTFSLSAVPARLEEVVTTGSGSRRRLEVGNSIATINADSIVPNTPIRNLSDLLRGRAAGVAVSSTSGAVGSGSRIRIRGVSSLIASSDPIVIVDGVRMDAGFSQTIPGATPTEPYFSSAEPRAAAVNQVTGLPAASRLNDIDPETIETVEVLKGPSAATLYGSDAANGVIVITTKKGRAGPTRWTLFGQAGRTTMDATFPEAWRAWGVWTGQPGNTECRLIDVAAGKCTQDSLTHFNPLNRESTSPLGTGRSTKYGASVSGGSTQLQYFVGADYDDEVGFERLPPSDKTRYTALRSGAALPAWVLRPNVENALRANSSLTAQLGARANVALTSSVVHVYHRDNASNSFIPAAIVSAGYADTVSQGWGPNGSPSQQFLTRSSDVTNRGTAGVQGEWHPTSYLSARGNGGVDYANGTQGSLTPTDILPGLMGLAAQTDLTTMVRTGDVGVTLALPVSPVVQSRTVWGGQYRRQDQDGVTATGVGLAAGSDVISGAETRDASEFHSASAIAGWYVEQSFSLNERAYVTGAVRADAASAFGNNAKAVYYPKWSASWLLSQEPLFPRIPWVNNLRLRAAFGHAGVQPDVSARFRSFRSNPSYVNGSSAPGVVVSTVGNPLLRPERSTELEGGFDLGLWHDRATFELTMYNKITRDALVTRNLPLSVGIASRQENIGRVANQGFELLATVRPIENPFLSWSATLNVSHDRNRLVSLGDAVLPPAPNFVGAGQGRYVVGYPLNGFWDRPIIGYADVNGDGIISQRELRLGDSAVYRGQPFPKATGSLYNNVSLWSGRVSVGVGLDFTYGVTQLNSALWSQCYNYRCPWTTDPSASLLDQAYALAVQGTELSGSTWGFLEKGSFARLNELSTTLTLPQNLTKRLRADGATFSIMGRNLKLWSHYQGADPEVNTNQYQNQLLDAGGIPQPREWSVRLNLRY